MLWPAKKNPIHKLQKTFSWSTKKSTSEPTTPDESPVLEPTGGGSLDEDEIVDLTPSTPAQPPSAQQPVAAAPTAVKQYYCREQPAARAVNVPEAVVQPVKQQDSALPAPRAANAAAPEADVAEAAAVLQGFVRQTIVAEEEADVAEAAAVVQGFVRQKIVAKGVAQRVSADACDHAAHADVATIVAGELVESSFDSALAAHAAREIIGSAFEAALAQAEVADFARAWTADVVERVADELLNEVEHSASTRSSGRLSVSMADVARAATTASHKGRLWGLVSSITDTLSLGSYVDAAERETAQENPFRWL